MGGGEIEITLRKFPGLFSIPFKRYIKTLTLKSIDRVFLFGVMMLQSPFHLKPGCRMLLGVILSLPQCVWKLGSTRVNTSGWSILKLNPFAVQSKPGLLWVTQIIADAHPQ